MCPHRKSISRAAQEQGPGFPNQRRKYDLRPIAPNTHNVVLIGRGSSGMENGRAPLSHPSAISEVLQRRYQQYLLWKANLKFYQVGGAKVAVSITFQYLDADRGCRSLGHGRIKFEREKMTMYVLRVRGQGTSQLSLDGTQIRPIAQPIGRRQISSRRAIR